MLQVSESENAAIAVVAQTEAEVRSRGDAPGMADLLRTVESDLHDNLAQKVWALCVRASTLKDDAHRCGVTEKIRPDRIFDVATTIYEDLSKLTTALRATIARIEAG